jgi:hypothetical protein
VTERKIELDPGIVGRDDFRSEVEAGLASFEKKDRAFDCKRCGAHFEPAKQQWVFYELCDDCFARFDRQKMRGRFASIGGVPQDGHTGPSFESVNEWISHDLARVPS